jgi:choline dehydrogenase-like flavoprotein
VLVLERGERLPVDGSTQDIRAVVVENRFGSRDEWVDGRGRAFVPREFHNLGGKTKWYGAALLRFAPAEFDADPTAGHLGWPIAYADLEPYYEAAEKILGVRHFETEADGARIVSRLERTGWRADSMPLGLAPEILHDSREAERFDAFASQAHLKSDAEVCLLDRLRDRPEVTIRTGAKVHALLGDDLAPHRIVGVVTEGGDVHRGDTVLLAAGALASPLLLEAHLRATGLSEKIPSAGAVGRNFKKHLLTAVVGLSPRRVTDRLRKTYVITNERFPHSSAQPLGAALTGSECIATELPGWSPRAFADLVGDHAYGFFLQTEDASHPDNRVTRQGGRPLLDHDAGRIPQSHDEHRRFVGSFARALVRTGMLPVVKPITLEGTAHACGTLVAGDDPSRSVVDAEGRVLGIENLRVVDGSVLPRSSRVNPALTIYAWSLRVADHVARTPGDSR